MHSTLSALMTFLLALPALADASTEDLDPNALLDDDTAIFIGCSLEAYDPERALDEMSAWAYELEGELDELMDELTRLEPSDASDALRNEHYEWRLNRDLACARLAREQGSLLAEIDCIVAYSEKRQASLDAQLRSAVASAREESSTPEESADGRPF